MCSRFVKCMFVFAELVFELTYKNVLEALLHRDVAFIEILVTEISINEFKFYIHRRTISVLPNFPSSLIFSDISHFECFSFSLTRIPNDVLN